MRFIDLTGKKFGRLMVTSFDGVYNKATKWFCVCSCGSKLSVRAGGLSSGKTKSCGCLSRELIAKRSTTHGFTANHKKDLPPEYVTWEGMKRRCLCEKDHLYKYYGGRGIKIHDSWRDFTNFLRDVGPKPTLKHSIERINNDGHYEPGNVRWATQKEQCNNRRTSRLITIAGETKTLAAWSELSGVHPETISARIKRGIPPELAIIRSLKSKPSTSMKKVH